ncbi:MAG: carbon-nitrogen hydrolase family protein [Robiginitomaculum sp.]
MRAACIQLCSGVDVAQNIEQASALIRAAAGDGATLIATPEMTGLMQRKPNRLWESIAAQDDDLCVKSFSALARELSITLLIGSLAIRTGEKRAANRSFLFGPDGAQIAIYDKIHLFDVSISRAQTYRESACYDGGAKAVCADISAGDEAAKLGLTICYDVRFGPLYKVLANAGAQIIAVPAAFTVPTGEAHWEVLLRARAIETGSFILAPAQGGEHEDGRSTWGRSQIIGPWGETLAALSHDTPGYIIADLDMEEVASARSKIPAWQQNTPFN